MKFLPRPNEQSSCSLYISARNIFASSICVHAFFSSFSFPLLLLLLLLFLLLFLLLLRRFFRECQTRVITSLIASTIFPAMEIAFRVPGFLIQTRVRLVDICYGDSRIYSRQFPVREQPRANGNDKRIGYVDDNQPNRRESTDPYTTSRCNFPGESIFFLFFFIVRCSKNYGKERDHIFARLADGLHPVSITIHVSLLVSKTNDNSSLEQHGDQRSN